MAEHESLGREMWTFDPGPATRLHKPFRNTFTITNFGLRPSEIIAGGRRLSPLGHVANFLFRIVLNLFHYFFLLRYYYLIQVCRSRRLDLINRFGALDFVLDCSLSGAIPAAYKSKVWIAGPKWVRLFFLRVSGAGEYLCKNCELLLQNGNFSATLFLSSARMPPPSGGTNEIDEGQWPRIRLYPLGSLLLSHAIRILRRLRSLDKSFPRRRR